MADFNRLGDQFATSQPGPTSEQATSPPQQNSDDIDLADPSHQQVAPTSAPAGTDEHGKRPEETFPNTCGGDTVSVIDIISTPAGLDILPRSFPVEELTETTNGMTSMDSQWTKHRHDKDVVGSLRYRWIHFPENNVEWAKKALVQIRKHLDGPRNTSTRLQGPQEQSPLYTEDFFRTRPNVFNTGRHHSRFMRPYYERWIDKLETTRIETVFMMPYLHWERNSDYERMRALVKQVEEPEDDKSDVSAAIPEAEKRFLRLLRSNEIQIRRSLDQSYYWGLESTDVRDQDQAISRYATKYLPTMTPPAWQPLLMVDQLWMWIFNDNGGKNGTIVTFFPKVWNHNGAKDELDVFEEIKHYLGLAKGRDCDKPMKLAIYMIDRCAGNLLDERPELHINQRYFQHFHRYIDVLMDEQKACLETLGQEITIVRKSSVVHVKKHAEAPFNIQKEFDILKQIRDIEEELLMIIQIVEQQQEAVDLLNYEYHNHGPEPRDETLHFDGMTLKAPWTDMNGQSPQEQTTQLQERRLRFGSRPRGLASLTARLEKRKDKLLALGQKATNTEKSIARLLVMKQQQASVLEARSSRQIAEASEQQSEAIMLFTIITIVFLPLGTIASIYGMNADEFGQDGPKLNQIWKVLFGVSVPLASVILYLAFHRRVRNVLALSVTYLWLRATHWFCFTVLISLEDRLETAIERLEDKNKERRDPKLLDIETEKVERRERREKKEKQKEVKKQEKKQEKENKKEEKRKKDETNKKARLEGTNRGKVKGKEKNDEQTSSQTPSNHEQTRPGIGSGGVQETVVSSPPEQTMTSPDEPSTVEDNRGQPPQQPHTDGDGGRAAEEINPALAAGAHQVTSVSNIPSSSATTTTPNAAASSTQPTTSKSETAVAIVPQGDVPVASQSAESVVSRESETAKRSGLLSRAWLGLRGRTKKAGGGDTAV